MRLSPGLSLLSHDFKDLIKESEGEKRLCIGNLLKGWKADVICLQETKMELITNRVIRSLWGCLHADWTYLGSNGAS